VGKLTVALAHPRQSPARSEVVRQLPLLEHDRLGQLEQSQPLWSPLIIAEANRYLT